MSGPLIFPSNNENENTVEVFFPICLKRKIDDNDEIQFTQPENINPIKTYKCLIKIDQQDYYFSIYYTILKKRNSNYIDFEFKKKIKKNINYN